MKKAGSGLWAQSAIPTGDVLFPSFQLECHGEQLTEKISTQCLVQTLQPESGRPRGLFYAKGKLHNLYIEYKKQLGSVKHWLSVTSAAGTFVSSFDKEVSCAC